MHNRKHVNVKSILFIREFEQANVWEAIIIE